jgi:preprotein translocase subunit SecA
VTSQRSLPLQMFRVDDLPIESGMLTDALNGAQKKVEAYFFNIRKQLWEYDQARALQFARLLPFTLL